MSKIRDDSREEVKELFRMSLLYISKLLGSRIANQGGAASLQEAVRISRSRESGAERGGAEAAQAEKPRLT